MEKEREERKRNTETAKEREEVARHVLAVGGKIRRRECIEVQEHCDHSVGEQNEQGDGNQEQHNEQPRVAPRHILLREKIHVRSPAGC